MAALSDDENFDMDKLLGRLNTDSKLSESSQLTTKSKVVPKEMPALLPVTSDAAVSRPPQPVQEITTTGNTIRNRGGENGVARPGRLKPSLKRRWAITPQHASEEESSGEDVGNDDENDNGDDDDVGAIAGLGIDVVEKVCTEDEGSDEGENDDDEAEAEFTATSEEEEEEDEPFDYGDDASEEYDDEDNSEIDHREEEEEEDVDSDRPPHRTKSVDFSEESPARIKPGSLKGKKRLTEKERSKPRSSPRSKSPPTCFVPEETRAETVVQSASSSEPPIPIMRATGWPGVDSDDSEPNVYSAGSSVTLSHVTFFGTPEIPFGVLPPTGLPVPTGFSGVCGLANAEKLRTTLSDIRVRVVRVPAYYVEEEDGVESISWRNTAMVEFIPRHFTDEIKGLGRPLRGAYMVLNVNLTECGAWESAEEIHPLHEYQWVKNYATSATGFERKRCWPADLLVSTAQECLMRGESPKDNMSAKVKTISDKLGVYTRYKDSSRSEVVFISTRLLEYLDAEERTNSSKSCTAYAAYIKACVAKRKKRDKKTIEKTKKKKENKKKTKMDAAVVAAPVAADPTLGVIDEEENETEDCSGLYEEEEIDSSVTHAKKTAAEPEETSSTTEKRTVSVTIPMKRPFRGDGDCVGAGKKKRRVDTDSAMSAMKALVDTFGGGGGNGEPQVSLMFTFTSPEALLDVLPVLGLDSS